MPKVYILLPVHNRKEITRGFMACLAAQEFLDYHLVLIDDGSSDGTSDMVRSIIPATTVLRGNGTWWWAGSLQQGLNWLKQRQIEDETVVLFINDDVNFAPDYLDRAVRLMAGKARTLVLSRFKNRESGEIRETGVTANLRRLTFTPAASGDRINCLSTRGLFAHWGDIKAIGDFYPRLLPHYLSDYEYTIRANRKGFKCETSAELLIGVNKESTGYRAIEEVSLGRFFKKYCSKRSTANPAYWSSFVLLASGPIWVIPNLLRVWLRASKAILLACQMSRNT